MIGEGGYGCVYSAHEVKNEEPRQQNPQHPDCTVAVKIEKAPAKRPLLKMETLVLKLLLSQGKPIFKLPPFHKTEASSPLGSRHAVDFFGCGNEGNYSYLAMELVGKNLNQLRRSRAYGRFSLPTAVRLGKKMLGAIRDVHNAGFVHRDIKPVSSPVFCSDEKMYNLRLFRETSPSVSEGKRANCTFWISASPDNSAIKTAMFGQRERMLDFEAPCDTLLSAACNGM